MCKQETAVLVMRAEDGSYYAIPEEVLAQCRVPDEDTAAYAALVAGAADDDAAGFGQCPPGEIPYTAYFPPFGVVSICLPAIASAMDPPAGSVTATAIAAGGVSLGGSTILGVHTPKLR